MLAPFFGYVGLAIATTLSATLNALMLYQGLKAANVFHLSGKTMVVYSRLMFSAALWLGCISSYRLSLKLGLLSFSEQVLQL